MPTPPAGRTPPLPAGSGGRLAEALRLSLAFRAAGRSDVAAFLAEHAPLRDLLEGMLEGSEQPPAADPRTTGSGSRDSALPRTFGDYAIDHELGRGGVGVVYVATQRTLGRRVALKVLAQPMLVHERALWRFQREARLLAQLEHPGIVRVIDAGTVGDMPFYAMELIAGAPLSALIDAVRRHGLATATAATLAAALAGALPDQADAAAAPRLRTKYGSYVAMCADLCAQVADALAFAHAAGIVHRDVKPGNILVRRDGTPLLSDFGIAVQEGAPSMTATGEFAGTPYYVSPEQARGTVDHRTDVYSLGVTLFEMLTLRRPFDGETTAGVLDRLQREEPPDPSSLNPAITPDLEAVVLKAMAKEIGHRYGGAGEFAADLRAWADGRPVVARRPTRWQRLRRWTRREPWQAAACAVGLALVAVSVTFTALLLHETQRTRDALHTAQAAETLANTNFEQALGAVDQMLLQVAEIDLEHVPQMEGVRRELLQRAVRFYADFAAQRSDDPRTRLRAARARESLGRMQDYLGDHRAAIAAHQAALRELAELLELAPHDHAVLCARAGAQVSLAMAHYRAGEIAPARNLYTETIAALEPLVAVSADTAARRVLSRALLFHGQIEAGNDIGRGQALLRRAIAELEILRASMADDVSVAVDLCMARSKLATIELVHGQTADAKLLLEATRDETERLVARLPAHVDVLRLRAVVHDQLAFVLHGMAEFGKAAVAARAGVEGWQALVVKFPAIADYRERLGRAWSGLGVMLATDGQDTAATEAVRQAVGILERLVTEFPKVAAYRFRLVAALANLGQQLLPATEAAIATEGVACMARALALAEQLHAESPADADYARTFAELLVVSGTQAHTRGESDRARSAFVRARDLCAGLHAAQPGRLDAADAHANALTHVAEQLQRDGDPAAAASESDRALAILRAGLQKEARQPMRRHLARRAFALRARVAQATGHHDLVADLLGELIALAETADDAHGVLCIAAGSLVAGGEVTAKLLEHALPFVQRSAAGGTLDLARLDGEPELSALREAPGFAELRRSLRPR